MHTLPLLSCRMYLHRTQAGPVRAQGCRWPVALTADEAGSRSRHGQRARDSVLVPKETTGLSMLNSKQTLTWDFMQHTGNRGCGRRDGQCLQIRSPQLSCRHNDVHQRTPTLTAAGSSAVVYKTIATPAMWLHAGMSPIGNSRSSSCTTATSAQATGCWRRAGGFGPPPAAAAQATVKAGVKCRSCEGKRCSGSCTSSFGSAADAAVKGAAGGAARYKA